MPVDVALLEAIRRTRLELETIGPPEERADGDFERVSLPKRDCDALRDLLFSEHAHRVIEIGLAYGGSALAIAEALVLQEPLESLHLVIDPFQERFHDAGLHAIRAAELSGFTTVVHERSQLTLPRLVNEGVVLDAAFVDGSHVFHNVFVDLCFLRELVRPGGVIVLDDCELASVATAVEYFEVNCAWQRHPVGADTRLRAYRLPNPRAEPSFEDFGPFGIAFRADDSRT